MRFVLIGGVDEKRSYTDKKTGETKFGLQVSWMGGSEFFMLTAEQFKAAPEKDQPVQIEGTFKVNQFGARYTAESISDPRVVSEQQAPQGRRAAVGA